MGDGLLDFGRAPIVKGHAPSIAMPMIERVRAAQGMKQAVVKVASYAHGIARVQGVMDYIGRKGKLVLETEAGQIYNREDVPPEVADGQRRDGFVDRRLGRLRSPRPATCGHDHKAKNPRKN